ncbi:MAG: NAD(P)-dependent oxidoreductase [Candidatus Margulisiibacteriota bacterium]
MRSNIFITGVTGCVGHYIFDLLVSNPDYQLFLLVRDPKRLKRDLSKYSNVKIIQDDLSNIKNHAEVLKQMDYVIHSAAGWGNTETNYDYSLDLFNALDHGRVKKLIYLSTASILDSNNKPNPEVDKIGTGYIVSKYRMFKELPKLAAYDKIITLFPTWVLGGDDTHPYSHAMEGILGAIKWLWLLRFFTFDLSFHFIHAHDIALIVNHLLKNEVKDKELVLGNPLISADQLIKEICAYFNKKIYWQIKITQGFVKTMLNIFGKKISEWDKYCLEKVKFEHDVVSAKTFGLKTEKDTISGVLKNLMEI